MNRDYGFELSLLFEVIDDSKRDTEFTILLFVGIEKCGFPEKSITTPK
jgi:hypothetical protein